MSIRVFLADDHAILREGIRSLIETRNDMAVIGEAENGSDALRQIQDLRPDVVVMDITMPGMSGIEATRWISRNSPGASVLILSMHGNPDFVKRALQAGAKGYVIKTSGGQEILRAIRTVHEGHRYLSPAISEIVMDMFLLDPASSEAKDPLGALSAREREVLQLISEGRRHEEIARDLSISRKTVETYKSRILVKLEIDNLADLIKFAIRHGLTSAE